MLVKLLSQSREVTVSSGSPGSMGMYKALGCSCGDLMKAAGRGRKLRYAPREFLEYLERETPRLARSISEFFRAEVKHVTRELSGKQVWSESLIDWQRWAQLLPALEAALADGFTRGWIWGGNIIELRKAARVTASVELANDRAVAWAKARAGFLVGMVRTHEGKYRVNPNTETTITATTRKELRALVGEAVQEGWSAKQLAAELLEIYAFGDARASTIARTELAFAHTSGSLMQWKEEGIVDRKQSILGSEHDLDDICDHNAEVGTVPLEQPFPSGHQGPPYHPNCVCAVIPILKDNRRYKLRTIK